MSKKRTKEFYEGNYAPGAETAKTLYMGFTPGMVPLMKAEDTATQAEEEDDRDEATLLTLSDVKGAKIVSRRNT